MTTSHQIDAHDSMRFLLAGNSTVTFRNTKNGNRFTYKIVKKENTPHFVSIMNGPDNELSYRFLGTIFNGNEYHHGRKSKILYTSQVAKVFIFMFNRILTNTVPDFIEIWHEGKCGRCGRKLTVPESIENGFGSECRRIMGW